jgi:hypothetical protein
MTTALVCTPFSELFVSIGRQLLAHVRECVLEDFGDLPAVELTHPACRLAMAWA